MTYQGHKDKNHWNVCLWINNDEGLYRMAQGAVRRNPNKEAASREILDTLIASDMPMTPDGAPYTKSSIRAALRGM